MSSKSIFSQSHLYKRFLLNHLHKPIFRQINFAKLIYYTTFSINLFLVSFTFTTQLSLPNYNGRHQNLTLFSILITKPNIDCNNRISNGYFIMYRQSSFSIWIINSNCLMYYTVKFYNANDIPWIFNWTK